MKVITAVVNNPIFIQIQYYTLKKYMKCDYEFIVFNDAKSFPDYSNGGDITIKNNISQMCNQLDITCINIPNQQHIKQTDAAIRCADSMNFILNYQLQNLDKYLLIDSDMFLIDYFDISEYEKYDCAVVLQSRNNFTTNYIWNGIYYFDFIKIKNINLLNWNCCPGCDVGGMMQQWLKLQTKQIPNTDEIRHINKVFHNDDIYYIKHLWSCSWNESEIPENLKDSTKLINFIKTDPRNQNGKFYCEIYDNKFLHYRAGGNWEKRNMNLHVNLALKLKQALLY
jgi:hypothetical protein